MTAERVGQPRFWRKSHGVYGKIPAGQVLADGGGKGHAVGPPVVGIRPLGAEGGDLHPGVSQHGGDRSVLQAGVQHGDARQGGVYLLRPGGGGNVPVAGDAPQQAVPDAAPHRKGGKAGIFQLFQHPLGVGGKIDVHGIPPPFRQHTGTDTPAF